MSKHKKRSHSAFEKLSSDEREHVYREIDEAPVGKIWSESKPLTAADRRRFERIKKKLGCPKSGKRAQVVPTSVEQADHADAVKILQERIRAADSGEAGIPAKKVLEAIRQRLGGARSISISPTPTPSSRPRG